MSFIRSFIVAVWLLPAALLAQYPGTANTYGGDPGNYSNHVAIDPVGADYTSPQSSTGSVKVNGEPVSGVTWVRVGLSLWIYSGSELIGVIQDYFDPTVHVDTDASEGEHLEEGGHCSPNGWWLRG